MAGTTNIPLTTLAPGTYHFGPASLADSDTKTTLTIDRTVTDGFNATAAATAQIEVDQSNDGGTTWQLICMAPIAGGVPASFHGGPAPAPATSAVGATFRPGTGRQARATVVISGAAVAVAGTLSIQ